MAQYKEPEPTFVQPISDVDGINFVNVVVDKIVSVSDLHFIYFKSIDAHVKMNLGSIAYTGELKPEVVQGAVARYFVNGSRVDFNSWSLVRDKDCKLVFEKNSLRFAEKEPLSELVFPENVEPKQPVQKKKAKPQEPVIKQKELYEVFNFYLESFTLLTHEDYSKMPNYQRRNIMNRKEEKYRELRRLLCAVQMVLENKDYKRGLKHTAVRGALVENGILRLREGNRFVRKMINAWDYDRKAKTINKDGKFLYVTDTSAILNVDWMDVVPSTDPTVFKRIESIVKKRKCDISLEDLSEAKFMRDEGIRGNRHKTL